MADRRRTRRQNDVVEALGRQDRFVSAQDLHASLRGDGSTIGLATVYRTLQTLVDGGEADLLRGDDGEALYRLCSTGHHHHLVCRRCGRTEELLASAVESWAAAEGARFGFTDVDHTVELVGTCADCHD